MNEFERALVRWGAIVMKFWIHIDPDTQLERFRERQNTPEKRWKITDEDWRNREKWPLYETAVNEMLQKTSTSFAPWYIIESKDKHYARLKVCLLYTSLRAESSLTSKARDKRLKQHTIVCQVCQGKSHGNQFFSPHRLPNTTMVRASPKL